MLTKELQALPIAEVLPAIRNALATGDTLVLQAPPGAGKTTVVPLALLAEPWLAGQSILLLEPRRVAARAAAARMAATLGERPGASIGYRIRLETCVSERTRVEVITEGILARRLQRDPGLDGVGLVIFDEFHERNLDSDLGLALTLQARESFREGPALKLLVMSATLDGEAVARLLGGAPVVTSRGRQFPVTASYLGVARAGAPIIRATEQAVRRALAERVGDILVFLPGQREINQVARALTSVADAGNGAVLIAPLHGGLSLQKQQQAIDPAPAGARKIVLATNIAETSLTIAGIQTVIDSGLAREAVFDPASGVTRLAVRRISKSSAEQRMGRAGRLAAGHCYRLWSEEQQQHLPASGAAEILHQDLASLALQLLAWGVTDPAELAWLDQPPTGAWGQALGLLELLGAASPNDEGLHRVTPHGVAMAQLPLSPREAHMLLVGSDIHAVDTAALLAAALAERNPLAGLGVDITKSVGVLSGALPHPRDLETWLRRSRQQARRYSRLASEVHQPGATPEEQNPEDIPGLLLGSAWPDRIGRRRDGADPHVYQLSNGRSAILPAGDDLAGCEWLAVAEVGGEQGTSTDRIYRAAALNPVVFSGRLAPLVSEFEQVEWDYQGEKFVAQKHRSIGRIRLSSEPLTAVPAAARQQALLAVVRKTGLGMLPWSQSLHQWRARVQLLHDLGAEGKGDQSWPDLSDVALLRTLEDWLLPHLEPVRKLQDFNRLDLSSIIQSSLPWSQQTELERLAPQYLTVPSGSRISIDYLPSPPVLAVKLQEMFGCEDTPRVAGGRVPLLVHLLSPAGRPLQVTQDLAGFWRGAYQAVKKEMKGRYPKHPWPDDPLVASPTRHTRKRRDKA
jgi:ATP-dependent helicase HrpB